MKKRIVLWGMLLLCVLMGFSACKEQEVHTHTVVIDPAVEATCTQDGKTEGQHCSTCNAILLMQTATPKTGHNYASEWTQNETHHWHEPTCSDTTEVKDKGEHRFDNGAITTYPTHTEKGVKTYTCQDCLYTKTEDVDPLFEQHAFASAWSTTATHHWHASTCGCQDQKSEYATHRFDNGVVTKQPTCTEKGEKTFTCGDCLYQKVEEMPTTNEHTFASVWSTDETHHWYAASCTHATEKKEYATHRFDNGVVTKQPTCTEKGEKTFTCGDCRYQKVEEMPTTNEHTFASVWSTDETHHWYAASCTHTTEKKDYATHRFDNGVITTNPTHTEKGAKTYTCQDCAYTKTEDVDALTEQHTFASAWSTTATHHWHASTCGCQDQKSEYATHRFDNGVVTKQPTCTEKGEKTFTCGDCRYQKTEEISATGVHAFAAAWSTNATHHWHVATCGCQDQKSEYATHRFDNGIVTKQPTCATKGKKLFTCGDCRYQKTEDIPATGAHTFAAAWSTDATHHWHASTCGCQDQKSEYATHRFNNGVVTKQPTCTEKGEKTYTCLDCQYKKLEEVAIIPHTFSSAWSKDATNHWHASTCGCQDQKSEFATHRFDSGVVTKQPTCTEKGEKTYTCLDCQYKKLEEIAIIPHTFSSAWSKDATNHWHAATCGCQDQKSEYATHRFDSGVVTKQPTCSQTGVRTYTCLDCSYQKTEDIVATGVHTYSNDWSKDQNYHWHAASCACTDKIIEKGLHSYNIENVCTDCGYTLVATEGLAFTLIDNSYYEVSNYTGSARDVVIPLYYQEIPVKSIGNSAFDNCDLYSVYIPSTVTTIGDSAFSYCEVLSTITIPSSVTSIGKRVFSQCWALTSITVEAGNPVYHSAGNCIIETRTKTLIAGCNNSVIPTDDSVTAIGDYAFDRCDYLTNITIPSSVTSIGDYAFFYCRSLESITIPSSVTTIGDSAIYSCHNLQSITFEDTTTWYRAETVTDWENKTNGIQMDFTDSGTNVTYFETYFWCRWYKK